MFVCLLRRWRRPTHIASLIRFFWVWPIPLALSRWSYQFTQLTQRYGFDYIRLCISVSFALNPLTNSEINANPFSPKGCGCVCCFDGNVHALHSVWRLKRVISFRVCVYGPPVCAQLRFAAPIQVVEKRRVLRRCMLRAHIRRRLFQLPVPVDYNGRYGLREIFTGNYLNSEYTLSLGTVTATATCALRQNEYMIRVWSESLHDRPLISNLSQTVDGRPCGEKMQKYINAGQQNVYLILHLWTIFQFSTQWAHRGNGCARKRLQVGNHMIQISLQTICLSQLHATYLISRSAKNPTRRSTETCCIGATFHTHSTDRSCLRVYLFKARVRIQFAIHRSHTRIVLMINGITRKCVRVCVPLWPYISNDGVWVCDDPNITCSRNRR